jgi:hypothetical protein
LLYVGQEGYLVKRNAATQHGGCAPIARQIHFKMLNFNALCDNGKKYHQEGVQFVAVLHCRDRTQLTFRAGGKGTWRTEW